MSTRIKICGITNAADALAAAELGVDFLGFNFVGGPRRIAVETAREIISVLPAGVKRVGLFPAFPTVAEAAGFDVMQHYDSFAGVSAGLAQSAPARAWVVLRVASQEELEEGLGHVRAMPRLPGAVVLDRASKTALGGTGERLDWNWVVASRASGNLAGLSIVLAGGLNSENVAEAIRVARPNAVDVSSGVELAGKPGIKDHAKMRDFVAAVRAAG